jgi:glyoxylase-like metal-dependent hydrolase (beta-lactamase superfamily II)
MRKIAEGIHQLEIPMRRNPLGKTYSYLLSDAGTLIDTGIPSDDGLDALEAQLSTLGLGLSDIEKILVTHMHTDHVGLIDRIQEKTAVTVVALEEAVNVQHQWEKTRETAFEDTRDEIAAWGGSQFLKLFSQYEHVFRRPRWRLKIDETITDRERLRIGSHSLEAFWTPGHAREHLCLHDAEKEIFFSGDHVLPKITSHISHHTYLEGDPLGDYLESLNRVRDLPVKIVLPGHERNFDDLAGRVSALEAHHEKRCGEIIAALGGGAETVFAVSSVVSWDSRPWKEMAFWTKRMAAAETYAHLIYLRNRERVDERLSGGVLVYAAA